MDEMRRSAPWMTIWDDRILEYIREEGASSASEMKDIDYFKISRSTISRRLSKLAERGMLKRLPNGVYVITDIGENYLEGTVDANELQEGDGQTENTTS